MFSNKMAKLFVFMSPLCLPLLQDLLNFDDPLNIDAAEHHLRDKVKFCRYSEDNQLKHL